MLFIFSVYCLNTAQMNFWEIVQQPQRNPDKGIAQMQIRGNLFTDYCCCQCSQIASFYLINYCIWCTCSLSLKAFTHRMRLFFKLLTGQEYFFTYFHIKLFYFLDQGPFFWTFALQKKATSYHDGCAVSTAHLSQQHQQQATYHRSLGPVRPCSWGSRLRGGTTTAPTWSWDPPSLCPQPSECPVKTMLLIHFPAFLLQICSCCLVVIHLVCINWGINLQTLNIMNIIMNINHKKPIVLVGDRICRNISVTICFAQTPECFFIPSWTAVQSGEISTCIFRGSAAHQKICLVIICLSLSSMNSER